MQMDAKLALLSAVALLAVLAPLAKANTVASGVDDESSHQVDGVRAESNSGDQKEKPTKFDREDLVELSRIIKVTKDLALASRCDAYESHLRKMFKEAAELEVNSGVSNVLDRTTLFNRAIYSLAARTVTPSYRAEQPYVKELSECVGQLDDQSPVATPKRTVVAGPSPDSYEEPKRVDPMAEVVDEFAQVKQRVVDPKKDLYAPKEAHDEPEHRAENEHQEVKSDLHHADTNSHHDAQREASDSHDHHEQYDFHQEHSEEHHSEEHYSGPHRTMDPHVMGDIVREEIEREDEEREIEQERDPVRKLERQLEREQKRVESLKEQLGKILDELESLMEEKEKLEQEISAQSTIGHLVAPPNETPIERSRYEVMKAMWEQATKREEQTNAKLAEVQKQLSALEQDRFGSSYSEFESNDREDEDDDSSDSDSDDEDNKDKVGAFRAKMVSKLEDKMRDSEPKASRCQKYFILLNYPYKVDKKVVKTVARLRLPVGEAPSDRSFTESLRKFQAELSRYKFARKASREIEECLRGSDQTQVYDRFGSSTKAAAAATASASTASFAQGHQQHGPNEYYHEYVSSSNEIPVTFARTNRRSSSFSRDHHSVKPFDHHHNKQPSRPLLPGVPTPGVQPATGNAFAYVRSKVGVPFSEYSFPPSAYRSR